MICTCTTDAKSQSECPVHRQQARSQGDTSVHLDHELAILARDAAIIAAAETHTNVFDTLKKGIEKIPEQMQFFVDSIVAMQKYFPNTDATVVSGTYVYLPKRSSGRATDD